ncbi:MAG TPA: outer membrane protein transport protein [Sulfurovum sp.]|nr:outer membrane protein transport protein [Sulfurovum sp.]
MNVRTARTLGKLITLSLITSTMLHATNGDNLIGMGAKSRGMGGTGIAMSHGAESALSNGALITSVESSEIGFGGTLFMPDIETSIGGMPTHTSDADTNMIPEVSLAHKIDENWYIGVGMWGTAGMGTDYSNIAMAPNDAANFNMVTNLQLMQFGVPIAYKTGGLSLAVTPILQYGNLDINYVMPNPDYTGDPADGPMTYSFGAGLAQDFGFGYNLGLAYDFSANGVEGLTLGAMYRSSIEMDYNPQLSTAMAGFNVPDFSDKLEQPQEYGIGLAYQMGQHTFAVDYKNIKWSDADGYGTYGWDDSNVYAIGYQYTQNEWTVRLGYNHADSAVVELDGTTQMGALFNMLNLLGFPATQEDHYTVGGTYEFTNAFSLDLAYVYAPTNSETFDLTAIQMGSITTDHSEDSISFQLAYKF